MFNTIQSWKNSSASQQYEVDPVKGLYRFLSALPCLIFLYINSIMLFTLRSKPVFTETPRYILLYNLLFADTVQLALGQLLYILATARVYLVHYVCLIIIMVTALTTDISPLNLAVMSLERYVAVCFPLRHASIVTISSTITVVAAIWAVCLVNILLRLLMLVFLDATPFHRFMQDFCVKDALFHLKIFHDFEKGFMCVVFVSVGTVIVCSYIGVIVTARSASSDKASASKARKTVLLHLIQLGLTLASTLHTTIFTALHGRVDRVTLVRIHYVLFLCLINLPRCLSCLIYGLRDQTIRPILIYHLSFCIRCPMMSLLEEQPRTLAGAYELVHRYETTWRVAKMVTQLMRVGARAATVRENANSRLSVLFKDQVSLFIPKTRSRVHTVSVAHTMVLESGHLQVLYAESSVGLTTSGPPVKQQPRKMAMEKTKQVTYLGNIISAQGIVIDPQKVQRVREFPTPQNVSEVCQFDVPEPSLNYSEQPQQKGIQRDLSDSLAGHIVQPLLACLQSESIKSV
ncbi:odorant receptor 131-2-like [Centroberyx gerrardi]